MKQMSFISRGHWVIASLNSRWGRQSLATSLLETGAGTGVKRGAALTVRSWLSAGISSSWRGIGLFLMLFSLSLIVGCGGGGGSSSGGDREDNRDNEELVGARWSIAPFAGGLSIEWHDLDSLNQNGSLESISITITKRGSTGIVYSINITDFVDGIYNLTSLGDGMVLEDGSAYRFTSLVLKYSDGSTEPLRITWWGMNRANNEADNNAAGIVVGEDGDGNGRADSVDMDGDGGEDNNTLLDGDDGADNNTLLDGDGGKGSDNDTVLDGDGGKGSDNDTLLGGDGGEDNTTALDGDGGEDNTTALDGGEDNTTVLDGDGGGDNTTALDGDGGGDNTTASEGDGSEDSAMVVDGDEVMDCILDTDCDNDTVLDDDEAAGCVLRSDCDNDGVQDDMDIDDDGDGLIEIRNASELDAVRYQLNGNGSRRSVGGELNTLGCGNGTNTGDISSCSGYELVRNISLTDHITEQNATAGWQPIAHDIDIDSSGDCDGSAFTGVFDGNGFIISGLFINRSNEDCVGLFGHVNLATIRHLGVVVDRVVGKGAVGGLVGYATNTELIQSYAVNEIVRSSAGSSGGLIGGAPSSVKITQSYAVSGEMHGGNFVGGLVGYGGDSTSIIHSYAVSKIVRGNWGVGGLMGYSISASIIHSYAVNGIVKGSLSTGGLVGSTESSTLIVQTYAVSDQVDGSDEVGGLVGYSTSTSIIHSYAVSGAINGTSSIGGLLGNLEGNVEVRSSYWDNETSGRNNDGATGSMGQTSMTLRSPISYGNEGIYSTWDDGIMAEGIDDQSTIWCDEDVSETIEADEMRANNHVWDFGTSSDYPAIRCVGDSLADQRAWWHLNATHKPQLNQTRLDAWLDGSLP